MVKLEHMEPMQSFLKKFGWSEYLDGICFTFQQPIPDALFKYVYHPI